MSENALTHDDAIERANALRANIVATQSAGWSTVVYPLVAILNDAGLALFHPSDEAQADHLAGYGGAGGYPGNVLRETRPGWVEPVGRYEQTRRAARRYLDEPTDETRRALEAVLTAGDRARTR